MSLYSDLANLLAVVEKDIPVALELKDAVLAVISDLSPGHMMSAAPGEDLEGCCAIIEARCAKHTATMNAAAPVGGIFPGDGSFLKAFLAIILQLLPLILAPKPAPTP